MRAPMRRGGRVALLCVVAMVWSQHIRAFRRTTAAAHRRDFMALYRSDGDGDDETPTSPILSRASSTGDVEEKASS